MRRFILIGGRGRCGSSRWPRARSRAGAPDQSAKAVNDAWDVAGAATRAWRRPPARSIGATPSSATPAMRRHVRDRGGQDRPGAIKSSEVESLAQMILTDHTARTPEKLKMLVSAGR